MYFLDDFLFFFLFKVIIYERLPNFHEGYKVFIYKHHKDFKGI